ncbi:MAG: hypothetical protein MHPSP_004202, partial [Paramarteilia canceri]
DKDGNYLIHRAVLSGNKAVVETLLERCPEKSGLKNSFGNTPFILAAIINNTEMIKM